MCSTMVVTQEEPRVWRCNSAFHLSPYIFPKGLTIWVQKGTVPLFCFCEQTVFLMGVTTTNDHDGAQMAFTARCSGHGGVFGAEWVLALSGWLNCRPLNTSQPQPLQKKKTVFGFKKQKIKKLRKTCNPVPKNG